MSAQRIHATDLARLLNSAPEPIYVLDDELTVVFLNQACHEWLGESADDVLGRRCAYHSSSAASGPDTLAAGLCPPPRVLAGQPATAAVFCPATDGTIADRQAKFVPLGSGTDNVIGVIAMLTPADAAPSPEPWPSTVAEAIPPALHEQIVRFRREAASRYRADRLIGNGSAMQLARRQIELAVGNRSSVLVVGPPGSGRRHLAAAVHYGANWPAESSLIAGGLVRLDCSMLGANILESVIAAVAKLGALGDAGGSGAVLLGRVDELSAEAQSELVLMLGRRTRSIRLLATAAQPLLELARRGMFRDDLAAMLSTIVIELPPLVQRREDLPVLAQMFLEDANAAGTRQIGGFSPAALDALDAYPWPGNLAELAEVVGEAHRRAAGPEIDAGDLPEKLRLTAQAVAHPPRTEETIVLGEYLARVERELIRRAIARSKGNKAQAARLLGITRPRLYRRMTQLGLEGEGRDEGLGIRD